MESYVLIITFLKTIKRYISEFYIKKGQVNKFYKKISLIINQESTTLTKAYVLLNAELGKEKDLYKELKSLSSVREVFRTYGTYDLIVQVEEQDSTLLKELIFHHIRKLDGVKQTITLMNT